MSIDEVAEAMLKVCWQGHLTFNDYRRMAQAAIDAYEDQKQVRRLCSYCNGTGIVPGREGEVWVKGVGWTVVKP